MQIATYNPAYLSRDDVPEDVVAKEREIAEATAREEGKPGAGAAQDHRGPRQRVLQGQRAARAGLRPRQQEDGQGRPRRGAGVTGLVRFAGSRSDRTRAPMDRSPCVYSRVLLKLSGEAFGGGAVGIDPDVIVSIARQIADVVRDGVQVAVVVGGGNYFRGPELSERGMDRARADYMGMLGTVMNCLALQDFLEKRGRRDAGADRDRDGPGRRALHPAPRDPPPREGPGRHLRRRPRCAVLLHRHLRRAARARDRLPGGAHGQGRRRCVRRRPARRTRTPSASTG